MCYAAWTKTNLAPLELKPFDVDSPRTSPWSNCSKLESFLMRFEESRSLEVHVLH